MKTAVKLFLCVSIGCLFSGFKADETPLEKLLKQLANITATYPQEKVHLQLDKPYYAVGEDIWIKAYTVTAEKNEPSLLSKVLYVDLINEHNEVRKKLILPMENGLASGNINLIDSLSSGNYRIRAYTNFMRNYSDRFFFEKVIRIGNVLDAPGAQKDKEVKGFNLQFFPEGGNLVAGIKTKIGIKAMTSDGLGANLKGFLINRNKEKVAEFITEHAGMGAFSFIPLPNESYTAVVTLADGSSKSFNFPKVDGSGYALAVNTVADEVKVRIAASENLIDGKDLFVIAQANGVTYASLMSKMDKPALTAGIPKKNFPTGLIHFTLFTGDSKPVAERLIFIDHHDELKINIKNTTAATTRKKMGLELLVTDQNDSPVDGSFSVSVTDAGQVKINEDEEMSILSNLLLTSDLKGFIEKPNYYFNPANADREKHLDQLLLTQGWSRFVWQDIISKKEPDITFRPEQTLEISGKILTLENKPLPNAKVQLFSNTPGFFLTIDTLSDARGNFVFDGLNNIPDSASFILQAKTGKDNKNIGIRINPSPKVNPYPFYGNSVDISPYLESTKAMYVELNKYNKLDKGILLKQVTIVAKKPVFQSQVKNSSNASGSVDQLLTKEMLSKEISIISALRKVPGVAVGPNGFVSSTRSLSTPMNLILDGTVVPQGFLNTLAINDIEGIEILTSSYNLSVLGPEGKGGVMYVTTKAGGGKPAPATNTLKVKERGFSIIKQFYSPAYDDPKTNQTMQDLRSTVYWNPNVNTDQKGLANFNFFNAGTPGTYTVTIEGMDAFGNIGRKTYTYEVKQDL